MTDAKREALARALWENQINVISLAELNDRADADELDYAETRAYLYLQVDAALAVFEKAHTPTDDGQRVPGFAEREKRASSAWEFFTSADREMSHDFRGGYHQGVIDEARRSEVPEPSAEDVAAEHQRHADARRVGTMTLISHAEPDGEPSDARPYPEVDAFAERMRAEMIANAHKGDQWRQMLPRQAWGEIAWHVGKLTAALKAEDMTAIRELAADIANGALMLDVIVSVYDSPAVTEQGEGKSA